MWKYLLSQGSITHFYYYYFNTRGYIIEDPIEFIKMATTQVWNATFLLLYVFPLKTWLFVSWLNRVSWYYLY